MGINKNIVNKYFVNNIFEEHMLLLQKKIRELICQNQQLSYEKSALQETIKKDQECIEALVNSQKDSKLDIENTNLKIKISNLNKEKIKDEDKIQILL